VRVQVIARLLFLGIVTMSCCPPGSWPALEAGETPPGGYRGTVVTLPPPQGDADSSTQQPPLQAYVVKADPAAAESSSAAASTRYGLISFQDIYEYNTGRALAVADQFASMGFTVVHVDFVTNDKSCKQGHLDMAQFVPWLEERKYGEFISPKLIHTVLPYLQSLLDGADSNTTTKIGIIGFCWGGYNCLRAMADPDIHPLVGAAVLFHPAFAINQLLGLHPECLDVAESVSTAVPALICSAGNDPKFGWPDGSLLQALQTRCPSTRGVHFDDMLHGWVIRGDVSDDNVREQVKRAIELAVAFLKEHL
jgi:dienelactone hydrolase